MATVFSAKIWSKFLLLFILNVAFCSSASVCTQAEIEHENLVKLATANNDFALKVYKILSDGSKGNIFFSPLSLSTAFGMIFYGARGDTAVEMRLALGYDKANLPSELVHASFNHFLTDELSVKQNERDGYTLKVANALLLDKTLNLVPQYQSQVQNLYHAVVHNVNFTKDIESLKRHINKWVKAKTNGKIESLVDDLSPAAVMVLLNAVYFKGTWKTQFQPEKTKPRNFYNNGSKLGARNVPHMNIKTKFPYTEMDDFQVLELPYVGENISMLIMLPNQLNGLSAMEKNFTLEKLVHIQKQLYGSIVKVSLPKFRLQYSKEMSPVFQDVGVRRIFSGGAADLSGMTLDKNVYVSQVLHKAMVEVNEVGSEAAAVTGIVSNRMKPMFDYTPEFIADHPFMFTIIDKRSGMILFVGRVNNL